MSNQIKPRARANQTKNPLEYYAARNKAAGVLTTLWAMIADLQAGHLIYALDEFGKLKEQAKNRASGVMLSHEERADIHNLANYLRKYCDMPEMSISRDRIAALQRGLNDVDANQIRTWDALARELAAFENAFENEMGARHIIFIPAECVAFYAKDALLGNEVDGAFPSAQKDIRDAGTCLALGLYTAAVFHLMRAVEFGIRVAADQWGNPIRCPIEYATWGDILHSIQTKLDAEKKTQPKTDAREANLQFYSGLAVEIRAFNYAWRDPIMHTRLRFDDPHEAENVFEHTKRFMQLLATRIHE